MTRIVIATCARWPEISESDRRYADALAACGAGVAGAPWNGPAEPFDSADAVVLRSTWDYHYDEGGFVAWLARLDRAGVPVFNAPALVRWNLHKAYLLDLAKRGVLTPATLLLPRDANAVAAALRERGWDRAVIKPAMGASGHNVRLVEPDSAAGIVTSLDPDGFGDELVLQEFMPEVRDGELSCVFLDGGFSHAFRRVPAAGEFRVNSQFEGRVERADPSADLVGQARTVLDALPEMPLYARVDGVPREGRFTLMELELIEPGLSLHLDANAAVRFAEATLRRLGVSPAGGRATPGSAERTSGS